MLNPVQDPKRRDHSVGGSSCEDNAGNMSGPQSIANLGYLSGGAGMATDTESARLSNV